MTSYHIFREKIIPKLFCRSCFKRRLFLKFEGFKLLQCEYRAIHLGEHRGGYSAFTFEITKNEIWKDNYIEVKVDNSEIKDVLPFGGDFNILEIIVLYNL